MSGLAEKIAAALSGLSPETKAALALLLSADKAPAVPRALRKSTVRQQLLDTRTVAELWLAGEDPEPRNRAYAKACKAGAAARSIRVTLADGFTSVLSSYASDDAVAKAAAIRSARSQAMEAVIDAAHADWLAACQALRAAWWDAGADYSNQPTYPAEPVRPWQWVDTKQGKVRTWACEVAAVATVEFLPEREREPERELTTLWAEAGYPHCAEVAGELSLVDTGALARRAARLAQAVETFSAAPTPAADSAETALEAPGEAPAEVSSLPVAYRRRGKRASRMSAEWAVSTSGGFVLFVGPCAEARKALRRQPGLSMVRLPMGWRERAINGVPLFANALAKVTGGRQRVRLSVVAA